ncbi:MAG TPA: phosphoribosylglycinamide synthetase C domain-containing protein, partial [Gemmatimonadales bacterium]|nr:phosphoribosylglycinamide synthetase C domain-containing protein [Gemmatimonadales bacterium]
MGAYCPAPLGTPKLLTELEETVFVPTVHAMKRGRFPFQGVLYAGVMLTNQGPRVLEFNCRLGDPEAQAVLPLVESGLIDAFWRIAHGEPPSRLTRSRAAAVTTVLAARGYPDRPEKGAEIAIPADLRPGVTVFHAGTERDRGGALRVAGGRVLSVTGVAPSFPAAQRLSRDAAERIEFAGKQFRRDIGWREAARIGVPAPAGG